MYSIKKLSVLFKTRTSTNQNPLHFKVPTECEDKPYIDFNTAKRREAKSPFLHSLCKSLNNMVFGNTMECLLGRIDLELVTNPIRGEKLIAKPTTQHWNIITDNLVAIRKQKPKICVDRPIYLGFCILDLSKIVMYQYIMKLFFRNTAP